MNPQRTNPPGPAEVDRIMERIRIPTYQEARAIEREALRLRDEAVREFLRGAGRGALALARRLGRAVLRAAYALEEGIAMARTYEHLSRLSDRQLADIGLSRETIGKVLAERMAGAGRADGPAEEPAAKAPELRRAA